MTGLGATPTTVTVKSRTLSRLRAYKAPGMILNDVLNNLMADIPPGRFWREIERRRKEQDIPAAKVYRRLGIQV